MKHRHLFWLAALLGLGLVVRAAEPDPEIANAVKTLQEAKIEPTGAALLRFFRERTLKPTDQARLSGAVRHLGDDDFETREKAEQELIRAGRKALPFLRPALGDDDVERARRAARCLQRIENGAEQSRIAAAARVLADRKPDGAAATMLAYLPAAESDYLEESLFRALLVIGMRDGKADPALVKALVDEAPLRRAAAAWVLGQLDPAQRPAVRRLLADRDARVRFEAALGLAQGGDKEAVPALIALLAEAPMPLAWRAQEVLYRIATDKAPALALTDDDGPKRARVADAWNRWWKDAAPSIDLAKVKLDETLQGVNLICEEADGGKPARVWACRADGKPLWEIKNVMAWDAQLLPNGHVLIAEQGTQGEVTERDTSGKVLMTVKTNGSLCTCQRLPNGNTFIGTSSEFREVDPKGTTLWTRNPGNGFIGRSHRLRNGNILYAAAGHMVVELGAAFQQLRSAQVAANGDQWMSVEPLPGDRCLIAPYGANKVMELDWAGKVLWECAAQTPMSVVRLPNGNTLVGSAGGHAVIEYDRAGKEVWKLQTEGRVRCARRY